MTQIITAPAPLPPAFQQPSLFLAGSVDDGAADRWQDRFIQAMAGEDLVLLNPRRDHWSDRVLQRAADPEFRRQTEWELAAQERADLVAMYFAPETRAPVSLLELGLFAHSGRLLVGCPEGFWRKGHVELVCERYNVPLVGTLEELIQAARARLRERQRGEAGTATILHEGRFLRMVRRGHWEYADRVKASGAAIILAVTDEQKLLLVEQHRIPLNARTIEPPAGIIGDEPGLGLESHAEAARRELLEETGYHAEHVEALTTGPSSGGLASEIVTTFRASQLRREGAGGGIAHEDIVVHEVPLSEVHNWLEAKARDGVLIDPKVYAGLYWVSRGKTTPTKS